MKNLRGVFWMELEINSGMSNPSSNPKNTESLFLKIGDIGEIPFDEINFKKDSTGTCFKIELLNRGNIVFVMNTGKLPVGLLSELWSLDGVITGRKPDLEDLPTRW